MSPNLSTIIARLRRAQPRNPDTMTLCDELEKRLRSESVKAEIARRIISEGAFDRVGYHREYQRTYMRDARAAKKLGISTAQYRKRDA